MFLISRIFLFLTKSADERDRARDDAYLAEATDIYDLEYRMKAGSPCDRSSPVVDVELSFSV